MSERCEDCKRHGRPRYVAQPDIFPSGIACTFGAVKRILCDRCVQNYEQPPAALEAERLAGIEAASRFRQALHRFRVPV